MAVHSLVHASPRAVRPVATLPKRQSPTTDVLNRFGTLPLRLFLGLTFIYAGINKIADPRYLDPTARGAYLGDQLQQAASSSPIGFVLQAIALPQIQLVGIAVVAAELGVGVLVTAGILTRPAAAVGAMLNLTLFLSLTWNIRPYFLAPDSLYTVAWITLALVGDAGTLTLQSYLKSRSPAHGWVNRAVGRANRLLVRGQVLVLTIGVSTVFLIWVMAILPTGS